MFSQIVFQVLLSASTVWSCFWRVKTVVKTFVEVCLVKVFASQKFQRAERQIIHLIGAQPVLESYNILGWVLGVACGDFL